VPTDSREETVYAPQKPLGISSRIVRLHSEPGSVVLEFFAGSGTTAEAAALSGRGFVLADENPEAARVMAERVAEYPPECVGFAPPDGGAVQ